LPSPPCFAPNTGQLVLVDGVALQRRIAPVSLQTRDGSPSSGSPLVSL
jgi:hypothetical protein